MYISDFHTSIFKISPYASVGNDSVDTQICTYTAVKLFSSGQYIDTQLHSNKFQLVSVASSIDNYFSDGMIIA